MAKVLFPQSMVSAYNNFKTLTDTDAAKQKAIQTVALMVVANAAYNASRNRLTQASISMSAATVLWMNQEAFLHKALSENVASFSVENERLGSLIGQFESIGMNLKDLTTSEREQLKDQMSKFNNLFQALTATVREQTEAARRQTEAADESHAKLSASVHASTNNLIQAQNTLYHVFQQVIRTCESANSAEQIANLQQQVNTLIQLAQAVLQQRVT